jgi:hypothetical protein
MDCARGEIKLGDGTVVIAFVCQDCLEKYSENELFKILVRKILH